MKQNKLTYVSLFSSAGVGCYGFKMEGFQCVATNELIERRLNVQKFNKKCKYDTGYILGDITQSDIKQKLFDEISRWKKVENIQSVDVLIATPPCQGMSVANHKKANDEIKRNSLVVESIKIVDNIKPKFFVFENVAAFMKTACTDVDGEVKTISEAIYNTLGKGYSIYSDVINFKNYGGNSSRTRTLVIGVRNDLSDFIAPIELFPDYVEEKTLRQVIGKMKRLKSFGEICEDDIYHGFRVYPEHMRAWISNLKEGESAFDNKDPMRIPHQIIDGNIVYNKNKNGDKYTRQIWDKVAPCIHTRNDQLASQSTVHPEDDRVFSIRELMKLMTIPDEFKWVEISSEELNKMNLEEKKRFMKKEEIKIRQSIGEAVPTQIFRSIAQKISFFLSQKHLKTSEINKIIENNDLLEVNKLKHFIEQNEDNLGITTLSKIAEMANAKRTQHAAYFTNKFLTNEIISKLPAFEKEEISILEPSVGVGNFLAVIMKKFETIKSVKIDVIDIDENSIDILKLLMNKIKIPDNITINYIQHDFLTYPIDKKYDLVIGNPPFSKLKSNDLKLNEYLVEAYNKDTTNTFALFLEKAIRISDYVALITPKFLLNTPEFAKTREYIEKYSVEYIIDFGESGFKDVLVETICIHINTKASIGKTRVISVPKSIDIIQNQKYIFDSKFPYWIIYRNKSFDEICNKMKFNVFQVFRDRQITNKLLLEVGDIRVIKSRNINDKGTEIDDIEGYDAYVTQDVAEKLSVYKFYNEENVYLTPNMTYKPRVMKKPKGVLVNGSVAILIPRENITLTEQQMLYYASEEYRSFYQIARNYQTRSLNVDSTSVFFFGILNE